MARLSSLRFPKMLFNLAGIFLVGLHVAKSQEETQGPRKLAQIWASPGGTVDILCRRPANSSVSIATWYMEGQDRTLSWIYESSRYSEPRGRYSGTSVEETFTLEIRDLRRNDSGVYYCFATIGWDFQILNGSRVIVAGGTEPTTTILVPSPQQGAPPNQDSPLLCLIWGAHPAWAPISWNITGVDSPDPAWTGDMLDQEGVFGLWSLQLVPPESWREGVSYTCSVPGNRNTGDTFWREAESVDTGNCTHILYWGVPCILTLLLALLVWFLFLRKRLARGDADQPETQIHTGGIPETEYATLGRGQ